MAVIVLNWNKYIVITNYCMGGRVGQHHRLLENSKNVMENPSHDTVSSL